MISDGEQLPALIVQECKIHLGRVGECAIRNRAQSCALVADILAGRHGSLHPLARPGGDYATRERMAGNFHLDRARLQRVDYLDACLLQRDEVAGQVAAVDSRYVRRLQHLQRREVVPVEEMTPITVHLLQ